MRGTWRLKKLIGRITPKAIILVYHRVANEAEDPQLLAVSPGHFNEHLQVLRQNCHPLGLEPLVGRSRFGGIPNQSVAITFDDGYVDNSTEAEPILARHDCKATVFVASGSIGTTRPFWWDELETLLLRPEVVPLHLRLNLGGKDYEWTIPPQDQRKTSFLQWSGWNVLNGDTPSMRHEIFRKLCGLLRGLSWEQQQEVLEQLRRWVGVGDTESASRRVMTADELMAMDVRGTISIGAHTVRHVHLSSLAADVQRTEITQSKRDLENILGHQVAAFAYPFGRGSDYTPDSVAFVRSAGFRYACSNFDGHVYPWTDRCQLPRYLVRNWDGDQFAARLKTWFQ